MSSWGRSPSSPASMAYRKCKIPSSSLLGLFSRVKPCRRPPSWVVMFWWRGVPPVWETGAVVSGAVELEAPVQDLVVNVFNPTGELVRRIEMGPQDAGLVNFRWEGLIDNGAAAAPGNYVVAATAQVDGQSQSASTLIATQVESVTLNQHQPGLTLNLKGMGTVDMDDIRLLL